jgi:ribosome-binding protein aMBF1 (putative translation factor)
MMPANYTQRPEILQHEAKQIFAEWHKIKRQQLGLSQTELAELLGYHPRQIQSYEGGQYLPQDFGYYKELFRSLEITLKGRTNQKRFRKSKPVYQVDKESGRIVKEYGSALEAGNALGIHKVNIMRCCNNKQKSAGGYYWTYKKGD